MGRFGLRAGLLSGGNKSLTDTDQFPDRPTGELIRLGLKGRCPRCGTGQIFSSYLKIAEACPACGLGLAGHDVGDGPVVPAMLVIGAMFVGLVLVTELWWAPPAWLHVILWAPLITGLVLWTLPRLKGVAVALQHRSRSTEEETPLGGH